MFRQKCPVLSAGSIALALFIARSAPAQDTVTIGTKLNRGAVTEMSPSEVTLDMAGVSRKIPVNEITKIAFGEEPTELTAARNAVGQKNYRNALDLLEKIDAAKVAKDFIKQDIAYYKAFCQSKLALTEGGNKSDAASSMFSKFYKPFPNNYHFYEAAEILGDLAVATGKYDAVTQFYGEAGMGGAPWPEYKLRAAVAAGRALVLAGKFDDAQKSFEAVVSSDQTGAEVNALKQHATVGKAQCLA